MERSGFAVTVPVELIDRLRAEGGFDLLGFYMSLASYVNGKSRVPGQLLFDSQAQAMAGIHASRNTFRKYFRILQGLGLVVQEPGRGLVLQKCAVHFADKAPVVLRGQELTPFYQEERNNNGNMDTLKNNVDQGDAAELSSWTTVMDPGTPEAQRQQFLSAMERLLKQESIKRGEQPSWIQQQLGDKLDIYQSMRVHAYVSDLLGDPDVNGLARGLLTAERDLAMYALEYIAQKPRRYWSGVVTMLERWAENDITSAAQAKEDHERRKEQDQDRARPLFTEDTYRSYIRKAMDSGVSYEEFFLRDEALPPYRFIVPLTRRRRKAIIKKAYHGERNGGDPADGRG